MTLRWPLLVAALSLSPAAFAQGLSGTWTAKDVTITVTQSGDQVEGTMVTDRKNVAFAGVVEGKQAFGEVTGPNGSMPFTLTLVGQAMKLEMTPPEGKALTFFLKRGKGGPPPPAPPASAVPTAQATPTAPAGGGQWKHENEGWSVNSPPGWKGGEQKDGSVMLGHDSEWGMLRIAHQLGGKLEEARAQANGFAIEGVQFTLTSPITELKTKAGTALVGDYQGQSMQGPMRVRNVALQGPVGILVISAMAPAAQFGKLAQHTEAMAASVTFFKARIGNAAQYVAGRWWHWHGSSSVGYGNNSTSSYLSSEKKMWLCPDGRFSRQGEFSASVDTRTEQSTSGVAGNRQTGGDGRWTAIGTAQAGKIIVTFNDGSREELPYQAGAGQGDKWELYVGGTGYLRSNDLGGCN